MLIKKPNDIPSSEITPKPAYVSRRKFITGAIATGAAVAGGIYLRNNFQDGTQVQADGGAKLAGIIKSQYSVSEKPTSFKDITNYNNYYEFSTDKYEPNGAFKNFRHPPGAGEVGGPGQKAE